MSWFSSASTIHHFKVFFPVPTRRIQNMVKQIQRLSLSNSSAVCVSLNGQADSPQNAQLLHHTLLIARQQTKLPIYSFLQDKATSLTYFTAASSEIITANPYCLIGDVGTTHKTYRNISGLLRLIGVKYEELGTRNEASHLWNQFMDPTQQEKDFTAQWLKIIQKNMLRNVSDRRNIPQETLSSMASKLYHPQEALKNRLIDQVGTFEEFVMRHYPDHKVEDVIYRRHSGPPTLSRTQISTLGAVWQVLTMPKVALATSADPLKECLDQLIPLLQARLSTEQGREGLQAWLEWAFSEGSRRLSQSQIMMI